ncbi:LuxR family transcriptional regulator [Quadrisphaera sp. GCM10027208]|jgi:quercetin dioxygenase-like cupin family protein|uniref:LuxR family transcriptional regulator n=1 Tax=Quadrisphaera sp. GCM10027208 TaxID=3273423 RepID=UPI00361673E1
MDHVDLGAVAREQAEAAVTAGSGRAAVTVFGGQANTLRQTVIALRAGAVLDDHENPGEATLHVLSGRVRLVGAQTGDAAEGQTGTLLVVPEERHRVEAVEDSVILLTVGKH